MSNLSPAHSSALSISKVLLDGTSTLPSWNTSYTFPTFPGELCPSAEILENSFKSQVRCKLLQTLCFLYHNIYQD